MKDNNNNCENGLRSNKKKWIILIISIICLIGGIISIMSYSAFNNQSKDKRQLQNDLDSYFSVNLDILDVTHKFENDEGYIPYEKTNETINAVGEYAKGLKSDGIIKDYEVTDGDSVWIQFNNGLEYLFSPRIEGYDSHSISTYQPFLFTYPTDLQELSLESVDGSASKTVSVFDDYEFKTNLDNESVSLDEIKNIGQSKIAIWHGHGVYNSKTHSTLATSLKLDKDQFLYDPIYYIQNIGYTDDFLTGRIICHSSGYVLVGDKFFEKYLSNIDSSVIYLGACSSGKDDVLANSFIKKGAKSVFVNSDIIHTDYNLKMIASVFDALVTTNNSQHYNNVSEALELAKTKNGKVCCTQNSHTEVKLIGKDDTSLSNKIVETPTDKPTVASSVSFDITQADVEAGSAIDVYCTSGHNLDDGELKTSAGDYSKCFKVNILGDRFNIIANQEGSETFTFTASDGSVGSFKLNAVKPKEKNIETDPPKKEISNDLIDYLYTNIYDFADMMGDMQNVGATDGSVEYSNGKIIVSSSYESNERIVFISLSDSNYCVDGVKLGMTYNEALMELSDSYLEIVDESASAKRVDVDARYQLCLYMNNSNLVDSISVFDLTM